jgi:hypothetical protein
MEPITDSDSELLESSLGGYLFLWQRVPWPRDAGRNSPERKRKDP